MNERTDEEIIAFAHELWKDDRYPNSSSMNDFEATVARDGDAVRLTVKQMYEHPGLSMKHLKALSEFFGTDNINDDDRFSNGGCESCDYGSEYGFTLTARPV